MARGVDLVSTLIFTGLVLLPQTLSGQVTIPPDPAGPHLLVTWDPDGREPILTWTGPARAGIAVDRSADPAFPGPSTTTLIDPLAGPSPASFRDSGAPPGLVFYRLTSYAPRWPFWEACWRSSSSTATAPATVQYDNNDLRLAIQSLQPGNVEAVHFNTDRPMVLTTIRIFFLGPSGPVEIHLWGDYGRSWPDESNNLIPPIVLSSVTTGSWTILDISAYNIQIHPMDHFWVGYVHQGTAPFLAIDTQDSGTSRARLKDPDYNPPYVWLGIGPNQYGVRVEGYTFCPVDQPMFADLSSGLGFDQRGEDRVAWGDANGDRWDDLLLDGKVLLLNDQAGGFTDYTAASGLDVLAADGGFAVWGDLDNDRDQDLYVAVNTPTDGDGDNDPPPPQPGDPQDRILLNDGNGVFSLVDPSGVEEFSATAAAAMGDYNADGFLDIYVGNWLKEYPNAPADRDFLFQGVGDGTFTDVTDSAGMSDQGEPPDNRPCYGVAWADYDNDGDLDIFVGNYGRRRNFLWQNQHAQGQDTFTEVAESVGLDMDAIEIPGWPQYSGGNTFGEDWGDFDNDGDMDLVHADISHPRYHPDSDISGLQVNSGPPGYTFTDERETRGIHYDEGGVEVSWADFDNDGDLDLLFSYLYTLHWNRFYRQDEDGTFTDITYEAGLAVHDATNHAWADYDRDGDLDLLMINRGGGSHVWLFENLEGQDAGNWLTVRLEGAGCDTPGGCNCGGVGARVSVTAGGLTRIREVQGGKGHANSQPSLPVEFGLGDATAIDELRVRWPCGAEETYSGAGVNQFLLVREGQAAVVIE